MARTEKIVLKRLRASYPKLFERDTMSGKYGCDLLIRKDDPQLDAFKRVCDLVAKDCKGCNPKKAIKMELLTDGAEKSEELSGYFIIKAKTNQDSIRNNVFRRTEMGLVQVEDDGSFYGGCNCEASVSVHWYDFEGKVGLHVLLNGICQTDGGEPFGSDGSAKSDFEDGYEEEDPV